MQGEQTQKTKFIVGLGNPGRRYERTRHNVGFEVIDVLARRWQAGPERQAFDGLLYDARFDSSGLGLRVMLLKPRTFMNRSGEAAARMAGFYKAAREDVLVVLDDMALPLGQLRLRAGGSSGGHKGLADVIAALGGEDVPRLRIGIGCPPEAMDATDFVLTMFAADEIEEIRLAVATAAEAAEDWVVKGMAAAMEKYNRKTES